MDPRTSLRLTTTWWLGRLWEYQRVYRVLCACRCVAVVTWKTARCVTVTPGYQHHDAYAAVGSPDDDVRENIIHYDEEGVRVWLCVCHIIVITLIIVIINIRLWVITSHPTTVIWRTGRTSSIPSMTEYTVGGGEQKVSDWQMNEWTLQTCDILRARWGVADDQY